MTDGSVRCGADRIEEFPQLFSFVGLTPVPICHGMTIGELALYYNGEHGLGCALSVIPVRNWRREMYYDETRPRRAPAGTSTSPAAIPTCGMACFPRRKFRENGRRRHGPSCPSAKNTSCIEPAGGPDEPA